PAQPARPRGRVAGRRPLMGWLDGKRALVAGAGSGIGRAVVDAFISEGAHVGALERAEAKAARLAAELPDCVVTQGDATIVADTRAAVEAVTSSFGGLDVLVNCVGIFDFYRGLADLPDEVFDAAFDEMFAVNVKSQLVTVRAALPELRRAGGPGVLTASTGSPAPWSTPTAASGSDEAGQLGGALPQFGRDLLDRRAGHPRHRPVARREESPFCTAEPYDLRTGR